MRSLFANAGGSVLLVVVLLVADLDAYALGIALCANFIGYWQGYDTAASRAAGDEGP